MCPSADPLTARLRAQVVFELHGSLGLGLASRTAHSPPEITELHGQAATKPQLRLGQQLFAINGQEIRGMEFDQTLHLIKVSDRPLALTFLVPRAAPAPRVPPRTPATPERPTALGLPALAAESEDVTDALGSPVGREVELASPLSRQDSARVSADKSSAAAAAAESSAARAAAAEWESTADIIAQGLSGAGGAGGVEDEDRPRVRLDASARRADPANASGANLAVHDMAVFRQKIEGAAKDVAPLSAQAVRCLPCARAGILLRG